jgi:1,4-dihydroxy-2-naphthoyl-CoA synthase
MPPSITRVGLVSQLVLSDTEDRVCTVTLNRPDARNAMSSELQRALAAALADAEADDGVDVVGSHRRRPGVLRRTGSPRARQHGCEPHRRT